MQLCTDVCTRAIHLRDGKIVADGPVDPVVGGYLAELRSEQAERRDLSSVPRRTTVVGEARLIDCRLTSPAKEGAWVLPYGATIELAITVLASRRFDDLELALTVCTAGGVELLSSLSIDDAPPQPTEPGSYQYRVRLPGLKLAPRSYYLGLALRSARGVEDELSVAVHFDIAPTLESTAALVHRRKGAVIPALECTRTAV
jgi:hypothetical protein